MTMAQRTKRVSQELVCAKIMAMRVYKKCLESCEVGKEKEVNHDLLPLICLNFCCKYLDPKLAEIVWN